MASSSNWTSEQNKLFENALTLIDEDAPGCWEVVAKAVGDKTVEEVKRHYEMLVHDIGLIEAGRFPLPKYKSATKAAATNTTSSSNKRG